MSQSAQFVLPPILVVEDNDDDFDTVAVAARRAQIGNRLVHARDADEARSVLAAVPAVAYALVLLDSSLPGDDGLGLLEELRRHPRHRSLPVVVLTASSSPRDRNAFYGAGANAYHVKTVKFADALANLEQVFRYWMTQVILPTTDPSITGKS